MAESAPASAVPAVPFLQVDAEGGPYLAGSRCQGCGETTPGTRTICPACGARSGLEPIRLGSRGRLYSYTVVHRSFPGVNTPFVSAIVSLEGGGTIKGTLLEVAPDPAGLHFDMPVDVVFRDSGQKSADGRPFLAYCFVPALGDH